MHTRNIFHCEFSSFFRIFLLCRSNWFFVIERFQLHLQRFFTLLLLSPFFSATKCKFNANDNILFLRNRLSMFLHLFIQKRRRNSNFKRFSRWWWDDVLLNLLKSSKALMKDDRKSIEKASKRQWSLWFTFALWTSFQGFLYAFSNFTQQFQ